jgi:hypothetical protein
MPVKCYVARISNILFSPQVAALAAVMVTLVILGCMCLSFGGGGTTTITHEDPTLPQEGSVKVPANSQLDVFYPVPYGAVPNLTIEDSHGDCLIVEQKENHFRIHNKALAAVSVEWKAKGVRVAPAQTVTPPTEVIENLNASPPIKGPIPVDTPPNVKVGQPK